MFEIDFWNKISFEVKRIMRYYRIIYLEHLHVMILFLVLNLVRIQLYKINWIYLIFWPFHSVGITSLESHEKPIFSQVKWCTKVSDCAYLLESAGLEDSVIFLLLKQIPKHDVLSQTCRKHPGLLGYIRDTTFHGNLALGHWDFLQNAHKEGRL